MQIRTKLTLKFIGITAFLLLSSLLMIYYQFSTHLKTEYYSNLQSKALMTVAMLSKNNPDLKSENDTKDPNENILPSKENILVYNARLEKLFSFHEEQQITPSLLQHIKKDGNFHFSLGKYDAIGITYITNTGKELIIIAKGLFMSDELVRLANIMMITFCIFLLVMAVVGYYFSKQALQPVTDIMNEMDKILPSDLSGRLTIGKNKDEISRLSITFNKLLDRIEEAFNIQKGFLSNIAHELRNPLGAIISSIQVSLAKDRSTDEYKSCLHSVMHDAEDLEHTSKHLMELAKISAQTDKVLFGPLRLDEIVWQSKAAVKKSNPGYAFKFDGSSMPENADELIIHGNEALLKTAFINLFENACKFSPDHTAHLNIYKTKADELAVEIIDTANVIADREKEQIFKPFYRSNTTQAIKGSGIGLSLVASILNIHEAILTIKSNGDTGNIFTVYVKTIH